jgi:predicted nuclease of predicted toxin-antitoxin system
MACVPGTSTSRTGRGRSGRALPARHRRILFPYAAEHERVLVTCDKRIHALAMEWLKAGNPFRMVFWRFERHFTKR